MEGPRAHGADLLDGGDAVVGDEHLLDGPRTTAQLDILLDGGDRHRRHGILRQERTVARHGGVGRHVVVVVVAGGKRGERSIDHKVDVTLDARSGVGTIPQPSKQHERSSTETKEGASQR